MRVITTPEQNLGSASIPLSINTVDLAAEKYCARIPPIMADAFLKDVEITIIKIRGLQGNSTFIIWTVEFYSDPKCTMIRGYDWSHSCLFRK